MQNYQILHLNWENLEHTEFTIGFLDSLGLKNPWSVNWVKSQDTSSVGPLYRSLALTALFTREEKGSGDYDGITQHYVATPKAYVIFWL